MKMKKKSILRRLIPWIIALAAIAALIVWVFIPIYSQKENTYSEEPVIHSYEGDSKKLIMESDRLLRAFRLWGGLAHQHPLERPQRVDEARDCQLEDRILHVAVQDTAQREHPTLAVKPSRRAIRSETEVVRREQRGIVGLPAFGGRDVGIDVQPPFRGFEVDLVAVEQDGRRSGWRERQVYPRRLAEPVDQFLMVHVNVCIIRAPAHTPMSIW